MRRFGGVACVFVHAPFVFGGFGCVEEGKAERCDRSFETKGLCASVDDCPSWQTLEAGLARAVELLPEEPLLSLHYEECENGLQIDLGLSPHSFDYYQYDLATKELVGVGSFGDGVTAEDKCNKLPFVDCNNRCSFVETSVDTSWLYGGTACSGPLAEPFIADCNEAMASLSEECRSCACEACYPDRKSVV